MKDKSIVVGTRGSELALVQAEMTESRLRALLPEWDVRRKVIKTTGDRRTDVALHQVAQSEGGMDKGIFTKELEIALTAGEIDLAVHSLKDVPTVLAPEFQMAAALPRAAVRDALIFTTESSLTALPIGARVGTSSVRRARQLRWLRPDLEILDLRGNVPTRLRKLRDSGQYDAIMLAEAGLTRLGFLSSADEFVTIRIDESLLHAQLLDEAMFFPAAGQGAIGLEVRAGDERMLEIVGKIGDSATWCRVCAEREFLRLLNAGCHTPVGVYTHLHGGMLQMSARVFPELEGEPRLASISAPAADPWQAALQLFESLV